MNFMWLIGEAVSSFEALQLFRVAVVGSVVAASSFFFLPNLSSEEGLWRGESSCRFIFNFSKGNKFSLFDWLDQHNSVL